MQCKFASMNRIVKIIALFICLHFQVVTNAQSWTSPELASMYEEGIKNYNAKNYTVAASIFQKMLISDTANFETKIALAKSFQGMSNYKNVVEIVEPLIQSNISNESVYTVLAQAYASMNDDKKALKVLENGIAKVDNTSSLWYNTGLVYKKQKKYEQALQSWIEGMNSDPNYAPNYKEAAIAYVQTTQPVWAVLYAEIYLNLINTNEVDKELNIVLLDAYQKMFFTPSQSALGTDFLDKGRNSFIGEVQKTFLSLFYVVSDGINTENLNMLRCRFVINWVNQLGKKYPFSLFNYQNELMKNGSFDAYNQWLYGKTENPQAYNLYAENFTSDLHQFYKFKQQISFKISKSDIYNTPQSVKGLFAKSNSTSNKR